MRKTEWTIFIFILLILTITYKIVKSYEDEGHEFMNDIRRCCDCHTEKPESNADYRDLRFVDDIVNLCHKCHTDEFLGRSHPVNLPPPDNINVPEDLHLGAYLYLTCATCHDPHKDRYSNVKFSGSQFFSEKITTKGYKTYFLRRSNIKSALCFACHSNI